MGSGGAAVNEHGLAVDPAGRAREEGDDFSDVVGHADSFYRRHCDQFCSSVGAAYQEISKSSVATTPGATVLTVMSLSLSSRASRSARDSTAPFDIV